MKHCIGVYLNSQPQGGGTFQYNLSIVRALLALAKDGHRIIAFVEEPAWKKLIPAEFEICEIRRMRGELFLGEWIRRLTGGGAIYRLVGSMLFSSVRAINQSDCDLVVFPSQDPISFLTKKKSLCTIHDLMHRYESHFAEYQGAEYAAREMLYSNFCMHCEGILVDSTVGKAHVLESYHPPAERVHPLPFVPPMYLLESRPVDIRSKYGLPERYVFYPAQFWEHKNHLALIEAVALLKSEGCVPPLVLVGSRKNNFEKIKSLIETRGLQEIVHVLGFVDNEDMSSLYRNAVALVFVSLIGPTNIPPLEAMLLGCPVIVSRRYAMPEQVGEAAILVDPESPREIAQAIRKLWTDEDLRKDLIARGLTRASSLGQDSFDASLEGIVQKILRIDAA